MTLNPERVECPLCLENFSPQDIMSHQRGECIEEEPLEKIVYPGQWQLRADKDFQIVSLSANSPEWIEIGSAFRKGFPSATVKILKIERIENRQLWLLYYFSRKLISRKNSGQPNEARLFHGSKVGAYSEIIQNGFDHRLSRDDNILGSGSYFADCSRISRDYVSPETQRKMLYCRVVLGSSGPGNPGMRRPEKREDGRLYDSALRQCPYGMVYAIFDNTQVYPEYLITYSE